MKSDCTLFRKHKADSLCDELWSYSFTFLAFCRRRGHTSPMAIFYATFPLSIHFAGCYDLARFWIWPYRTFKTYILIIKSQQKYTNFVYFGNYLRISVSIGTSAKCRSYSIMLHKADTLLFKTKVIYSLYTFSSFILCCFCFPKLSSMVCRN